MCNPDVGNSVEVCPVGKYCPDDRDSGRGIPCPPGTYNSIAGGETISDCTSCDDGKFCPESGMVMANSSYICEDGFNCRQMTNGTNNRIMAPRPKDHICPIGSSCQIGLSIQCDNTDVSLYTGSVKTNLNLYHTFFGEIINSCVPAD